MAPFVTAAVVVGVFAVMLLLERRVPLRKTRESKGHRTARNLAMGGVAFAVATSLQTALLVPFADWTISQRIGLLHLVELPIVFEVIVAVLLMDYLLWVWHWANHRVPLLWRFHLVHHIDRDMDSSTALRFHFGEHAISTFYRALQIAVVGASPGAVWVWQILLFISILFHHGNVQLPIAWERRLVRIIVTPRMHAIHHSDYQNETDSNWSSLFSWWDYLHGTILLSVPQRTIRIGVPAYESAEDVTLGRILMIPFRPQRRDWYLGDDDRSRRVHDGPVAALAE